MSGRRGRSRGGGGSGRGQGLGEGNEGNQGDDGAGSNAGTVSSRWKDDEETGSAKVGAPKFDPDNYHTWAFDMESHLADKGVWCVIDEESDDWDNMSELEASRRQRRFFEILRRSLGNSHRYLLLGYKRDKVADVWRTIKERYGGNSASNRLQLHKKWGAYSWKPNLGVEAYIAGLYGMISAFETAKVALTDEQVFTKMLSDLPAEYGTEESIMQSWEVQSMDKARTLLIKREETLKRNREQSSGVPSMSGASFAHVEQGKKRRNPNLQCFYCGKLGHPRFMCPTKSKDEAEGIKRARVPGVNIPSRKKTKTEKGAAHVTTGVPAETTGANTTTVSADVAAIGAISAAMGSADVREKRNISFNFHSIVPHIGEYRSPGPVTEDEYDPENPGLMDPQQGFSFALGEITLHNEECWILDSAATHHICMDSKLVTNLIPTNVQVLTGKRGATMNITKMGEVILEPITTGEIIRLRNVLFDETSIANIISIPVLMRSGCVVMMKGQDMEITRNKTLVLKAMLSSSGLFVLTTHMTKLYKHFSLYLSSYSYSLITPSQYHARMGHLHPAAIKHMVNHKLADGLPEMSKNSSGQVACPHCMAGKSSILPFDKSGKSIPIDDDNSTCEVLDEVHSDQAGKIQPRSRYKSEYIIEFIDKASRMGFIYGMQTLDESFEKYKVFRTMMLTQIGKKIKKLVTDGHPTYTANYWAVYCQADGTLQKFRTPHNPQQNPIAERRIRTIFEMARTLMIHACIQAYCWEDAVLHANYIRNRVWTRVLSVTPYEKFWNKKPDLSRLRPFGCLVYVFIHKEQRVGKFSARALPGVMMGISDQYSGYKIQMLDGANIKISRDVRFYEDIYPYRMEPVRPMTIHNPLDCPAGNRQLNESTMDSGNPMVDQGASLIQDAATNPTAAPGARAEEDLEVVDELRSGNTMEGVLQATILMLADGAPKSLEIALKNDKDGKWKAAAKKEFGALSRMGTFKKATPEMLRKVRSHELKVHGTRSIPSIKLSADGEMDRAKVRTVVQGYSMVKGVDYDKSFSPSARMPTIRFIVGIATMNGWKVTHSDVPNAYLNGKSKKLILVKLPKHWNEIVGPELGKDGDPVVLYNSLYGAPDAGRNWNDEFNSFFLANGYKRSKVEPCVYIKMSEDGTMVCLIVIYVDDIFSTGNYPEEEERILKELHARFQVVVLGPLKSALGIEFIWGHDGSCHMKQTGYIDKMCKLFLTETSHPVHTPMKHKDRPRTEMSPTEDADKEEMKDIPYREAIGSLIYLAICTRPEISFAVSTLAEFSNNPGRKHWEGVLYLLKYVKVTRQLGLKYRGRDSGDMTLILPHPEGYSDSSFKDRSKARSTIGSLVYINARLISWKSRISTLTPQSVMEAEIIAANQVAKEIMWTRYLIAEMRPCTIPSSIHCDNDGAVGFADETRVTDATKHILPKYYYVREVQDAQGVVVRAIGTKDQIADSMTKALDNPQFSRFRGLMNVE
jgi:hypothetical protein